MAKILDGWHTVGDCRVYVEDGCVRYGSTTNRYGSPVSGHPFRRSDRYRCWENCTGITLTAFRALVYRGRGQIM